MTLAQEDLDRLWDFDDPAGSERALREAADDLRIDAVAAQEYMTQVARAVGLQGRLREADAVLDGVQDLLDEIGPAPAVAARLALERGRIRHDAEQPDEAISLFLTATDSARDAGATFLLVDALHMLAIVDAEHAEEWTRVALAELDAESDARTRRWEVSLRHNLGWTIFDRGDPAAALREFEAALEAAEAFGTAKQVEWARDAIDEVRNALAG